MAMAKSPTESPGSAGSQFFVVTNLNIGYPAEHALLGAVSKMPVLIEKITIEKGWQGSTELAREQAAWHDYEMAVAASAPTFQTPSSCAIGIVYVVPSNPR
jgi:cyclophilin family peptidyl-prolyl cis-trans isomerase